jgi:hypothetical protein
MKIKIQYTESRVLAQAMSKFHFNNILYGVYKSGMSYTDSDYILFDEDFRDNHIILDGRSYLPSTHDEIPSELLALHVTQDSANKHAKKIMRDLIELKDCDYILHFSCKSRIYITQKDIFEWARIHTDELPLPEDNVFKWDDRLTGDEEYEMGKDIYYHQMRFYACEVLNKLSISKNYDLIEKIYTLIVGKLSYVRETILYNPN